MDETIICPNCGESNPADMAFCHNCQWRLRPLGENSGKTGQPSDDGAASDNSVPDWLRLAPTQPRPELAADEAAAEQLRNRLASPAVEDVRPTDHKPKDPVDLLAGLTQAEQPDEEPIPDWVARIMGITDSDDSDQLSDAETETQANLGPDSALVASLLGSEPGRPSRDDNQFDPDSAPSPERHEQSLGADGAGQGRESDDIYAWLRQLDASTPAAPAPPSRRDVPATTDVPTWVGRMLGVSGEAPRDEARSDASLPNWLQGSSFQGEELPSSGFQGGEEALTRAPISEPPRAAPIVELPAEPPVVTPPVEPPVVTPRIEPPVVTPRIEPPVVTPRVEPPVVTLRVELPLEPSAVTSTPKPASSSLELQPTESLDVDAVFASMQMPPWAASGVSSEAPGTPVRPPAAQDPASIELADLPSWVQAMRPVESAVAAAGVQSPTSPSEAGGPLRGIEGVLPAIPGAAVSSSHPKPQVMRTDISDKHRTYARLLQETLEAETRPFPLKGRSRAGAPRTLRWVIGAILLPLLMLGLVSGSSSFLLPAAVPAESNAALQVVQSLTPDAPVLAVFDYEPATAGEMEVAAASILDHLLLLKHPRLAVLSTSPTGSALAERFISTTLRERAYARGLQYVDLGYLAGGLAGVRSFAQDPVAATPYGAAADRLWDTQVLAGARALTDFGAIIVLTDSLESGSVWIEQTTGLRGAVPLLLVTSAQAGPILLPYFDSGQIQGMLVGINGAAGAEIVNGGRPGLVRRYWDAYNFGLYSAAVLIVLGAFWQLTNSVRRRRDGDA